MGIGVGLAVARGAREHFCKRWRAQNLVPCPLPLGPSLGAIRTRAQHLLSRPVETFSEPGAADAMAVSPEPPEAFERGRLFAGIPLELLHKALEIFGPEFHAIASARDGGVVILAIDEARRSAEHTSELQSLMRNSYAVFCLKKKQ